GSMHKWPCGPKEKGLLYVNKAVHDRIHPSVVGVYAGAVGISRTMESHGQRDDASVAAVTDALKFQETIGRASLDRRARQPAQALMEGLKKLDGVTLWTDPNPARSSSIVIFRPGTLDPRKLNAALSNDRIVATATTRGHTARTRAPPR